MDLVPLWLTVDYFCGHLNLVEINFMRMHLRYVEIYLSFKDKR